MTMWTTVAGTVLLFDLNSTAHTAFILLLSVVAVVLTNVKLFLVSGAMLETGMIPRTGLTVYKVHMCNFKVH